MTPEMKAKMGGQVVVVNVPMQIKKRGGRRRIIVPEQLQQDEQARRDYHESLALAVSRAHLWKELIENGKFSTITEVANAVGLDPSFAARIFRLTMLAPDIVDAILTGNEPSGLSMRALKRPIPLLWEDQRRRLGFSKDG